MKKTASNSAPSPAPSTTKRTVLKAFIGFALLQSVVLIGIAVVGHQTFKKLDDQLSRIEPYTEIFTGPASPRTISKLGDVLRAVVGDFVLGASNGQISMFLANIVAKDFAGVGRAWENAAVQLAMAMSNTTCNRSVVECPLNPNLYWNWNSYPQVQCPGSPYAMTCYGPGMQFTCNNEVCAFPIFRQVAKYVEAAARKLEEIPALVPPTGTPAMSNGLFQLDGFFHWFTNQAEIMPWKAAGTACLALSDRLRAVNWNGSFVDGNGNLNTWDINRDMRRVVDVVQQFCDGFSKLPAS